MTNSNYIKLLLNVARHYRERKSQSKGFTLPELLMAMVVAGIVVYAMLSLVISLLGTDKTETAKSETQAEMSQAMDYIARDLQQAVYIYPGDCLETDQDPPDGDPYTCKGLSEQIAFPDGVTPVLAFWKLEEVADYMDDGDSLPTCTRNASNAEECYSLLTSLHTYTLVVYSYQEVADDGIWKGPNMIRRFQLRKYTNVEDLATTPGYSRDPGQPNPDNPDTSTEFGSWESELSIAVDNDNNDVLVDLVDQDDDNFKEACPTTDYTESAGSISSFYACVKNPSSAGQDAIVYLRGNAAERAGKPNSRNPVYLPSIKRQVKARSVLNYTPPDL